MGAVQTLPQQAASTKPAVNPWVVALTVTLATFMELLDTSIANVSLPHIAGGLGRSFDEVTWILTTYLVANAVVLPMSAWLSRVFGRKNYYMACVTLFTITSFFCGIAPSLGIMLFSRVLQGIGGGGLAPVEQAILIDTFPPAKRASAFALYTVAIVTAPAIGPVLGGWITDNYNWRWVFLINIPIGILSLYLTNRFVHDPPTFEEERSSARRGGRLKIDTVGISLIALGSAALEILLDRGQIDDWFGSTFICWLFAIALACFIAAIYWELKVDDPILELRLLRYPNFAIASTFYFVFGFGLFATTTMIPQLLQSLYGYRAIDAGLVLGPGALVITLFAPVGAQLVQRKIISPKLLLGISLLTLSGALIYYSNFTLQTDYRHYVLARAYQGLGYAFFFVPLNVMAYSQLKPNENNRASSLTNLFRNWGGSFGISFATTLSERRQSYHQSVMSANLPASGAWLQESIHRTANFLMSQGYSKVDATRAAYLSYYQQLDAQTRLLGFMDVFRALGWFTLAVAPLVLLVRKFHVAGKPTEGH
ncbi:MAG: DHA2 family efflux MFS transporter permease subunit [Edaphobacter sp.]|uniref:DHA2 family efflux MFS transporter permease subunit n=1 Tax=Edaphobacter sp. TaxID=1934404 RepID=UPI0023A25D2C|nr:DHA2 family efflux MFS transporter permease subunit [Edaphobacter sp.]MDE1176268.1 DHA2 family efflux MFS transporter permease subunit [Edaphobacter sp.]